jgi:HD-GYP domain-containing protein (c-di-GMP phosphodiesterase class II)
MRLIHSANLSNGMEVGEPVHGASGQMLLAPGVKLTDRYIDLLHKLDIPAAYVADPDTAGIHVPQPLKPRTRAKASHALSDAFERLAPAAKELRASEPPADASEARASGDRFAKTCRSVFGSGGFRSLIESVQSVITDLMDQRVLIGLNSIKTHDAYTFQHSIDVTIMGVVLAKRAGWDASKVRLFGIGCMLHDIGKVFIPEELLRKPGRLTPDEFDTMKRHPKLGYDLIKSIAPTLGSLVPQVAYQHHERQDGSGYPRSLTGNNTLGRNAPGQIHEFGSLAAVADVYDAMASMRPYRKAWAPDQVVQAIIGLSGDQLNRDAVEIFRSVVSPYPVCSEVIVLTGTHAGCRGVVAKVDPAHLARPVVRIISSGTGKRVEPFEVDLRSDPEIVVRSSTATDEMPVESMGGRRQEPRKPVPLPDEVVAAMRKAKATPSPLPKRLAS